MIRYRDNQQIVLDKCFDYALIDSNEECGVIILAS